jgi:hypothetical protein
MARLTMLAANGPQRAMLFLTSISGNSALRCTPDTPQLHPSPHLRHFATFATSPALLSFLDMAP